MPRTTEADPARAFAAVLAAWELAAIGTHWVPTISATWWRYREHPVGRFVLAALWGWLTWHLWVQKSRPAERCTRAAES